LKEKGNFILLLISNAMNLIILLIYNIDLLPQA